jgi:hypothetical protein
MLLAQVDFPDRYESRSNFFSIGSIIIDDIVLPGGHLCECLEVALHVPEQFGSIYSVDGLREKAANRFVRITQIRA